MPFSGGPDALEKNDELIKVLKAAPDVLYERFCQFGQVNILSEDWDVRDNMILFP